MGPKDQRSVRQDMRSLKSGFCELSRSHCAMQQNDAVQ